MMAVTSLWRIKGRVGKVVDYAVNPAKTENPAFDREDISTVISYAMQQEKTEGAIVSDEGEQVLQQFVSGINCCPGTAVSEMMAVKRRFGKEGGTTAYHGYQSFAPGEATPEIAHEIAVRLAERLWGEKYQVVVATHLDKANHLHSHFVLNTVSFADGKKFHRTAQDYRDMQIVSDELCREYGLSVVKQPESKSKSYAEWQAETEGHTTLRGSIRADIDRAIVASTTGRDFIWVMTEMGYELKARAKDGQPLKYPALKPPGAKGYFRFHKLGAGYNLDEIKNRILQNIQKQIPFPKVEHRPSHRYRLRGKPRKRLTGLQALYFRYCYELHIIQKRPTSVKKVSFQLREDIARLEHLDRETLFLAREGITTMEQLSSYKGAAESKIEALTTQRQELRRELRRLTRKENQSAADEVREQIGQLSQRLKKLRKEVVFCDGITLRSGRVKENLGQLLVVKREKAQFYRRGANLPIIDRS
jgi:hypothetical protein